MVHTDTVILEKFLNSPVKYSVQLWSVQCCRQTVAHPGRAASGPVKRQTIPCVFWGLVSSLMTGLCASGEEALSPQWWPHESLGTL